METLCSQAGCACDQDTCNLFRAHLDVGHAFEEQLDICQCHLKPLVAEHPDMILADTPDSMQNKVGINWARIDGGQRVRQLDEENVLLRTVRNYALCAQIRLTLRSNLDDNHKVDLIERLIKMKRAKMIAKSHGISYNARGRPPIKRTADDTNYIPQSTEKTKINYIGNESNSKLTNQLKTNLAKLSEVKKEDDSKLNEETSESVLERLSGRYNLRRSNRKIDFKALNSDEEEIDSEPESASDAKRAKLHAKPEHDSEEIVATPDLSFFFNGEPTKPEDIIDPEDTAGPLAIFNPVVSTSSSSSTSVTFVNKPSNIIRKPDTSVPLNQKVSLIGSDLARQLTQAISFIHKKPVPVMADGKLIMLKTGDVKSSTIAYSNTTKSSNGGGNINRAYLERERITTVRPSVPETVPSKQKSPEQTKVVTIDESDDTFGVRKEGQLRTYSSKERIVNTDTKKKGEESKKNSSERAEVVDLEKESFPKEEVKSDREASIDLVKECLKSVAKARKRGDSNMAQNGDAGKRCIYHPLIAPQIQDKTESPMIQPPRISLDWKKDVQPDAIFIKVTPPRGQAMIITHYYVYCYFEQRPVKAMNQRRWKLLVSTPVDEKKCDRDIICKFVIPEKERRCHFIACAVSNQFYSPFSVCVSFIRPDPNERKKKPPSPPPMRIS